MNDPYTYGRFEGLQGPYTLELDWEPYQSYEVGVWVDEEGGYYLGTDTSCSCYTRDGLTGPMKPHHAIQEITNLWNDAGHYSNEREEKWLTEFIEQTFHVKKKENN